MLSQNDEYDEKAKVAYEALMTFQIYEPDTEEYHSFQNNVKKRIKEDFNLTEEEERIYAVGFEFLLSVYRNSL